MWGIAVIFVITLALVNSQNVSPGVVWKLPGNTAFFKGFLWRNSDIVFVEPDLRAETVQGVSQTGKICGFTMTNGGDEDMFFISQVGQGWAEVRRKVSVIRERRTRNSENSGEKLSSVYLEAYDCDELRHYSVKAVLKIISLNEETIEMDRNEYKLSVRRDIQIGSVIGSLKVLNSQSKRSKFQYRVIEPQFVNQIKVLENGNVVTMKSFQSSVPTVLSFRVLVTEVDPSREVARKAVAQVTITLLPICQPKLNGMPDELEYYQDLLNPIETLERNEIIQPDSILNFETCDYSYDQIHSVDLTVRIKKTADTNAKPFCHLPSPADDMRNEFCSGFRKELTIYPLNSSGKDSNKGDIPDLKSSSVRLKEEFSVLWWMKRAKSPQYNVMCLLDMKTSIPILFITMGPEDCTITVSIATQPTINQSDLYKYYKFDLPKKTCYKFNEWSHFVLLKENKQLSLVNNGKIVSSIQLDDYLKTITEARVKIGKNCVNLKQSSDNDPVPKIELDSITLDTNKAISLAQIRCLVQCQNSLVLLDDKKMNQDLVVKYGQVLEFNDIQFDTVQSFLSRISFIRLNILEQNTKTTKNNEYSDIEIDLVARFKSKLLSPSREIQIKLPTNLIRINYPTGSISTNSQSLLSSSPTKISSSDDGVLQDAYGDDEDDDVEILLKHGGKIVLDNKRNFEEPIKLLEGIKIENSDQPSSTFEIESCSVRPLERQLHPGERIYLDKTTMDQAFEWGLKEIRDLRTEWKLENPNLIETQKYTKVLSQLNLVTAEEKRRFSIMCLLKNDEYTIEASVEVIQKPVYVIDDVPNQHVAHKALHGGISRNELFQESDTIFNSRYQPMTKDKLKTSSNIYSIAKSRFIAVIIMAVVGGAAWSLMTAGIAYYLLRQRHYHNLNRRAAKNNNKRAFFTPTSHNQLIDSLHMDNRLPHSIIAEENTVPLSGTTSFSIHPPNSMATSMSNVSSLVQGKNNSNSYKDLNIKQIGIEDISEYPPTFYDHHEVSGEFLQDGVDYQDMEHGTEQCHICDHDANHIMFCTENDNEGDEDNDNNNARSNLTRSNTINLPITDRNQV